MRVELILTARQAVVLTDTLWNRWPRRALCTITSLSQDLLGLGLVIGDVPSPHRYERLTPALYSQPLPSREQGSTQLESTSMLSLVSQNWDV